MTLRDRLARWLAPNVFAELKGLRSEMGAVKTHAALQIDLSERVSHNFQGAAASANAQYERLYALVFDRLTPAERKRLSLDVGLPLMAMGSPVAEMLPDLSAVSLLRLVQVCDELLTEQGRRVPREQVLSADALEQIAERHGEWLALEDAR